MVDIKDLPQDLVAAIRERFDADARVKELRRKKDLLQRSGNYLYALQTGQEIDALFKKSVDIYIQGMQNEEVSFGTETANIPQEHKDALISQLMVLFMCCDVIQSAVMDFNSILHKTNPDLDISSFNDMLQLSKMAKTKMRYLENNSEYMNDLVWADKCDDMYAMMQSKAKAIVRKRKDSKNWGKNFEKLGNK